MRSPVAFDSLIDLLIDMVCVVDEAGKFVFVSAACERLLGYTPDELIGTSMIELVHPDDRERTLHAAAGIMQGQWRTNLENRYVRKDGQVVDIMWSARWSPEDRVRVAVARDVTERKRAERIRDALYLVSEAAHAADTLLLLYERLHSIIGTLLPADSFTVALYDEPNDTLTFPYCVSENELEAGPQPLGSGTRIARVIRGGEALHSAGSECASTTGESGTPQGESGDWLGVPLQLHGRVMGALVVESCSEDVRYSEDDRNLLEFVSTQVAITIERKQAEVRLQHKANHDALTDLPGRTLFQDRFDMALRRARREGERIALLYIDIDRFKQVNDAYGHEAGDALLCAIAQRLSEQVRDFDTVARIGGDEFTVLLGKVSGNDGVAVVVDRIHATMSDPFDLGNERVTISVSIGAAVFPEEGETREELIRRADADMYARK
jgi:diguanylate cyclase (GGDEF)-like protein/PAS domain S-box-containing protein